MLAKCKYYGWAKQIGNVAATARTAKVATNNLTMRMETGHRAISARKSPRDSPLRSEFPKGVDLM